MKRYSQLAATAALLFTSAVLVKADPIDPVFHMDDPGTGLPITSLGFSFSSNESGAGFFQFMNESEADWCSRSILAALEGGGLIQISMRKLAIICSQQRRSL